MPWPCAPGFITVVVMVIVNRVTARVIIRVINRLNKLNKSYLGDFIELHMLLRQSVEFLFNLAMFFLRSC